MNELKLKRLAVFSSVTGVVAAVIIVLVFAGNEGVVYRPSGTFFPKLTIPTDVPRDSTNIIAAAQSAERGSYEVSEWGVVVRGIAIESHFVTETGIVLETSNYKQTRLASDLTVEDFAECYHPYVELKRTAVLDAKTDANVRDTWKVKQELDSRAKRIGDFYYYISFESGPCLENPFLFDDTLRALRFDGERIMAGLE